MKVMLVSPHFPPRFIGGVETYTKRLADYLSAHNFAPSVVCVEQLDSPSSTFEVVCDTAAGYPVYRLHGDFSGSSSPWKTTYHNESAEAWLLKRLQETSPDVVHLHSGYLLGGAALAAARRCEIPTVVTLHDYWFICARITLLHPTGTRCTGPDSAAKCAWCLASDKRRYRLPDALTGDRLGRVVTRVLEHAPIASLAGWADSIAAITERNNELYDALTHATLVLSPSRFLRDLMQQFGFAFDRIQVSRLGIEQPQAKTQRRPRGRGLSIGFMSQLAPHKGVGVLVEALRHLPGVPITVRIYGDPARDSSYATRLKDATRDDPRIEFCGPYRHEHVYDILAQLDAVVVPSLWYENSPLIIQEAQAARVPVIASRLGGMRELVTEETDGLLFEPGDAHDLAKQLRRLVDDPTLLERLRPDGTSVRTVEDEMQALMATYRGLARVPD